MKNVKMKLRVKSICWAEIWDILKVDVFVWHFIKLIDCHNSTNKKKWVNPWKLYTLGFCISWSEKGLRID